MEHPYWLRVFQFFGAIDIDCGTYFQRTAIIQGCRSIDIERLKLRLVISRSKEIGSF